MGVPHYKTLASPKTYSCMGHGRPNYTCCYLSQCWWAVCKREITNNQNTPSRNLIRSQLQISSTSMVTSEGAFRGLLRVVHGRPRIVTILWTTLNDEVALRSGLEVLKRGGNAVDATVTTALCEGIYNSMASGVGGGGFLTILSPNSSAEIIDARETAPGAATESMYKGELFWYVEFEICRISTVWSSVSCLWHLPSDHALSSI